MSPLHSNQGDFTFLSQALINAVGGMVAALISACLGPMARPAPVPPASCWSQTATHATTAPRLTCCSPTASACAASPWTPVTTPMCMCPCPSYTTSSLWTMTVLRRNSTTLTSHWTSSGKAKQQMVHSALPHVLPFFKYNERSKFLWRLD